MTSTINNESIEFGKYLQKYFKPWQNKWLPNQTWIYENEKIVRDATPKDSKTEKEIYDIWIKIK